MPAPRKTFFRRLLEFRLLFVVNAVLLVLLALSFGREVVRNMEIQGDIKSLQDQAQTLEARQLEIAQINTAFQTESFIEREARLKLGLKKPGEEVVVIQAPDVAPDAQETQAAADEVEAIDDAAAHVAPVQESVANPVKWWYYFFDPARFHQL
jgi:cell division protein FtsB